MVSVEDIAKLPKKLNPITNGQNGNAAVALLLKPKLCDVDLLLVKRVENPSDTWSGQMALPGGKRAPKDLSLKETVMRETLEEIGIAIDPCQFLGVLNTVWSMPKPDFEILPFVVLLKNEPKLKLNKAELERFIWVPYDEIVQSRGMVDSSFGRVPAYIFADAIVWGVTYQILSELVRAVEASQK